MKPAIVKEIGPDTWQFTEQLLGENVYCYLLCGKEKALLIDTAYGFTDLASAVKDITDLPLTVVNTHGHFDHVVGNHAFGEACLSPRDLDVYRTHTNQKEMGDVLRIFGGGGLMGEVARIALTPLVHRLLAHPIPATRPLPDSRCFELGERTVKILETPGHTGGSIALLDTKNGWLFSGDNCGDEGMLLTFPEATTVAEFHQTIRSIRELVARGDVVRNYPSHQTSPAPLEKLELYDRLLTRMEQGKLTRKEWKDGAVSEGTITIRFSQKRLKEEVK